MLKFAKIFVGATFVFGTPLSMSGYSVNEAQAATTHAWYTYNGYTSKGGDFVLNQKFYNGLKSGNIKFNGVKVNSKYHFDTNSKQIYDQKFQQINGNKANNVTFEIQNSSVSFKEMLKKYGKHFKYQPSLTSKRNSKTDGLYGYKIGKGNIVFYVHNGYVRNATVS